MYVLSTILSTHLVALCPSCRFPTRNYGAAHTASLQRLAETVPVVGNDSDSDRDV